MILDEIDRPTPTQREEILYGLLGLPNASVVCIANSLEACAALGLTRRQADCVFRMAIANDREFTEEDLDLIAAQKRQVIRKTGILEYYEHAVETDAVQAGPVAGSGGL